MSDAIRDLDELLKEAGLKPAFGLRNQGHIPTIETMLAQGATWEQIAKQIGWDTFTAKQHYEWYLEDKHELEEIIQNQPLPSVDTIEQPNRD